MKFEEGCWFENDCRRLNVVWVEKERPEAEQQSVNDSQIGRTSTRPINDQELLFHKKAVGNNGLGPTGPQEFGGCC